MSSIVLVKEERVSPVPDTFENETVKQDELTIKIEACESWEVPCQNLGEEARPAEAVKEEPSDDQDHKVFSSVQFNGQNGCTSFQTPHCLDQNAISEHFLAFSAINKHNCQICFKSFANKANLLRHSLIHTRVKLQCTVCFKFIAEDALTKHMLKHVPNRMYPCDVCEKRFKTVSNLNQHKIVHSTERPYQCQTCKRGFAIKANLIRHETNKKCKFVSDEPLICHVCDKVFQKSFLLKSHLRKHDTDKPYTCDMCGLDFKYKSAIIRHMSWHSGSRPFKCNFCTKTFTHSGLVKPHLRTHTGEKPFQCSICLKFFTHKHNMERHKINHGRIKRLVCEICNKKFPRESRLIYHMKTHTREKFFDCGKCDKKFTHKSNVIRHYERKHPGFKYKGKDTDASVALKVWDRVKGMLQPHYDIYQQPEEILG